MGPLLLEGPSFGSPMILRGDPVLGPLFMGCRGGPIESSIILRRDPVLDPLFWEAEETQFWVPYYGRQRGPSFGSPMILSGDPVLGYL